MAKRYTLTPQDSRAIINTAARLGIEPDVLTSVIAYETMGTMNPTIKGGKGGNYQGLIQFGPPERRRYGFDADASFAEQVEGPVYRYLKDRGVRPGHGVAEVYSIINAGSLKNGKPRWNASDGNGTVRSHVNNIITRLMPRAAAMLQGAAPPPANMDAIADVANYSMEDGGDIYQPETAVAASPESAGAAINELQLMASGPPNALPVDAMAYNQARVQVAPPLAGQGGSETLVGSITPPTPRERPVRGGSPYARGVDGAATGEERWSWLEADAQPSGAPGVADLLMPRERPSYMPMVPGGGALGAERPEAGVPLPNLRPQRGESLTRPQDYISGDASQMTPEAMTADLYRARADQMPNPRVRPPYEMDVPIPRPRPEQAAPPMIAGRPEFPGALPAAPQMMPEAERNAVLAELDRLKAKAAPEQGMAPADPAMSQTFPRSVQGSEYQFSETPEQAYDRMTREREEFNAAMEAGTLPQRPIYSPDFSIASPGDPSQSLIRPPTQGAVFDPSMARPPVPSDITTANSPFAAGIDSLPRYSPAFDFAAAPAGPTNFPPSMGAINAPPMMEGAARLPDLPSAAMTPNMAGRFDDAFSPSGPSFADFLNSGGASPAAASVPPMKDQSRLPEFGGPLNTGGYGQAPMPRLDPVINAVDPIQIGPSSSIDPFASDMQSLGSPMGSTKVMPQYASSAQAMPVLPKPMSPPSISMDDFNSRFGSPGAVSSPVGWSVGMPVATAPTPSAAPPSAPSAPIDIRPPAAGGPPVSAPKFTPPPQIQPQQRERPIGNLLNTLVENVFGGGGPFAGNSFGSFTTPWSGQSGGTSSSFTATQSGKTPSGQEWNKGTVGPNEWNGGQYTNSRGTAVTYAENPFGGGYMVGYG